MGQLIHIEERAGDGESHAARHFSLCFLVMTPENLGQLINVPFNAVLAALDRRLEAMTRRLYLPSRRVVRFLRVEVAAWLLAGTSKDGVSVDAANHIATRGSML